MDRTVEGMMQHIQAEINSLKNEDSNGEYNFKSLKDAKEFNRLTLLHEEMTYFQEKYQ